MLKILHLLPHLGASGAARQVALLAEHLPRERFTPRVCVLGPKTPLVKEVRQSGVEVACLGRTRAFDVQPFLRLRREAYSDHGRR